MKKIVYDNIIFSLQNVGGISTYWYELSHRLINDQQFEPSFLFRRNENVLAKELQIPQKFNIATQKNLPLLIERFRTPSLNKINESFIFHSSYNRGSDNKYAKNVTTVHDLIHHKYYAGIRKWLHNTQKSKALANSDAIITVSNNTKKDLLHFFPNLNPEIVHVVYNGVSDDFYILDDDYQYEIPEYQLKENYILCVSSREPYKNFNFVVECVKKMPDFKLYIVGPILTEKDSSMLNLNIPNQWTAFSSISNKKLNELYNHAYALIYPSSYEGFGIPLLEAMNASCPFVALNSSSIPEVAGNAGILLDTLDINEFVKAIERVNIYRKELQLKGRLQVANFSWDKCYKETTDVYKELL